MIEFVYFLYVFMGWTMLVTVSYVSWSVINDPKTVFSWRDAVKGWCFLAVDLYLIFLLRQIG